MKNLFHRILDALNINGRDWAVLLLALLLAFSIWLIHNLSLKYNDYLSVSVIAKCDINGHSDVSSNRCEVIARCRATGYKVIRSSLKSNRTVEVSFRESDINHLEGDMFYITPQNLMEYSNMIFGADVTVEYFMTDTVFFRFPFENSKKVPVVPIYSLSYKDQYMAEGEIKVDPDSVYIYGEPFYIEEIDAVYTKPIRYYDIHEDVRGLVALENIKGVRLSETDAHYSLDVRRFVEMAEILPVKVVNVPSDKEITPYPSVVKVTLRSYFPLIDDPFKGLSVVVDYDELNSSLSGKCALKVKGANRGIISYDTDPVAVSCVMEDRVR